MAPEQRAANLEMLCGGEATCADLARRMESYSLFAGSRLIAVRQAQDLDPEGADLLLGVLDSPPTDLVLALFASGAPPRGSLWEGIRRAAFTVECGPLRGAELRRYLKAQFARDGVTIGEEALDLLLSLVGEDLPRLRQEGEKLILSLGPGGGRIDAERVELLLAGHRIHSVFELTNSLGERDLGKRLALLERLLDQGEPPLQIVFLLARQLRLYLEMKSMKRQGISATQAAGLLRIPAFRVRESYAHLERFSSSAIAGNLVRLQRAEMELKSSVSSPRRVLEWFFLEA